MGADLSLSNVVVGSHTQMEMHIFTELVGIQMLLMNTLERLLSAHKIAREQLTILISPSSDHQGHEGAGTPRNAQPEQGEIAMPAVQEWSRRESIIWPPRHYPYTLGAIFLSLRATRFFVYISFSIRIFTARTLLPAVLRPR